MLSATQDDPVSLPSPVEMPYFGGGKSALIVDDNPDFLLAMEQLLAMLAIGVIKAHDGGQGLDRLKLCTPDLIFLDLFIPVMNGMEFMQQVRAQGTPVPPVIVVTGEDNLHRDARSEVAEALGATTALAKPFTAHQLATAIARVLMPYSASGGQRRTTARRLGSI